MQFSRYEKNTYLRLMLVVYLAKILYLRNSSLTETVGMPLILIKQSRKQQAQHTTYEGSTQQAFLDAYPLDGKREEWDKVTARYIKRFARKSNTAGSLSAYNK